MEINRKSLLDKVKALLSKTLDNGCTEQEASSALIKAQAMMDAYEITEQDLELTKQEKAILRGIGYHDPHEIKRNLCMGVSKFTNTKCFLHVERKENRYRASKTYEIKFIGLPADIDFAVWLTDTLSYFIQGELAQYLANNPFASGTRRHLINGFVMGCAARITERLKALASAPHVAPSGDTRNALAVVQQAAIAEFMDEHGLHFGKTVRRTRQGSYEASQAGRAAGDRASFGRPVGSGGALRLGN
jgi:hypothetical protein